ncbi:MAG: hypothetical protein AUJ98_05000 [Bacteroidetes bacterium CG2_30_33_31]|nr:MAG: hypothetical protein AUJ98_05000 [Bacteroidetes bacterium CG2_30_33_31]
MFLGLNLNNPPLPCERSRSGANFVRELGVFNTPAWLIINLVKFFGSKVDLNFADDNDKCSR